LVRLITIRTGLFEEFTRKYSKTKCQTVLVLCPFSVIFDCKNYGKNVVNKIAY